MTSNFIPIYEPDLTGKEREYVNRCFDDGWISSQGSFIREFEEKFAKLCHQKYGVATSNCTTALHLSLLALGVGPGDEVLCPALTFIAPGNMVKLCGADLVLVDSERDSWNLDPDILEKKITKKTKAIIVVHAFGHSAKMDQILDIASRYDLKIIEDVAEAPGAYYKKNPLGGLGDLACFSFFGNKIMTCGEGGMIVTSDEGLKKRIELLRDHGMSKEKRYFHEELGFNYRMTNLQAAVGLAQLERLPEILDARDDQEKLYERYLQDCDGLSFRPKQEWCKTVHWLMTITLKKQNLRDKLISFLKTEGIDCRQMVFPIHMALHFDDEFGREDFPIATDISLNSLHLPSSNLVNEEQIKKISALILKWMEQNG